MLYDTITPTELHERMKRGEPIRVIDVREPAEHDVASVDGAELLPLSRFDEWADTLDPADELIVMCHHGIRSGQVCAFLARQGFQKLHNLSGGIDAWSIEVDRGVPRY
ncbi:MAG: rhodanese-like domain-containing protein [Acidobacteriota bacterium]|nr:rhodanese-like domain-containing protein [Acidobacteriota bacterium]